MQSVASDRGPMLFETRIVGTAGTARAQGDRVFVSDASGTREIACPPELAVGPADPPPSDLLVTAYDALHSTGIDLGPYTRLAEVFRAEIEGGKLGDTPEPATFADGLASMRVLDAIRRSAASGTYEEVAR